MSALALARAEAHLLAPPRGARAAAPALDLRCGSYRLGLARDAGLVEGALRLRFEVFNLELGEGLASSYALGCDRDEYDSLCDHLVVQDERSGRVVGTYRLLAAEHAPMAGGFYAEREFDLSALPAGIRRGAVELGRACVAADARGGVVLALLWRGIAEYAEQHGKRYLFGCASLPATEPAGLASVTRLIRAHGWLRTDLAVRPRAGFAAPPAGPLPCRSEPELPPLWRGYFLQGARACGIPAWDREFGTYDYFLLFDREAASPRPARRYALARRAGETAAPA